MSDGLSSHKLRRDLRSWQIFMIGISGILGGIIIFSTSGEILGIAGPGGVLLAFAIDGAIAIAVMEGLSEMIELWPISNAMMEFVYEFVDTDLAFVVGIAYWYAYASIFATLILGTAEFVQYWGLAQVWHTLILFIFCPVILFCINCAGVKYYGYIECVGGALKVMMAIGGTILMYVLANKKQPDDKNGTKEKPGSRFIESGMRNNPNVANNWAAAICLALPIVIYGFVGVEVIAVAAFEARDPKALRFPAKWIAWVIFFLEFFLVLGEILTIGWNDPMLPSDQEQPDILGAGKSNAIFILAPLRAGIPVLPGFLTGCIIFSILSSANTALYVASRTLYGLARRLDTNHEIWWRHCISKLGSTTSKTQVPAWALLVSLVSFCWLPLLHAKHGYTIQNLLGIMSTIGSEGCLIVWASQCLAFIRYRMWVNIHQKHGNLGDAHRKYNRLEHDENRFSSVLSHFQPLVAYFGLTGCLLIILVFNSASWWNGKVTIKKVSVAYLGPAILLLIWLAMKLCRERKNWYVKLDEDYNIFNTAVVRLESRIAPEPPQTNISSTADTSMSQPEGPIRDSSLHGHNEIVEERLAHPPAVFEYRSGR